MQSLSTSPPLHTLMQFHVIVEIFGRLRLSPLTYMYLEVYVQGGGGKLPELKVSHSWNYMELHVHMYIVRVYVMTFSGGRGTTVVDGGMWPLCPPCMKDLYLMPGRSIHRY